MSVPFEATARVPDDVLVSELDGEAVILNLKSEAYFGLDVVGARMWSAVTAAETIEAGYKSLAAEFDVDPDELRRDLGELIETLIENGLLEIVS